MKKCKSYWHIHYEGSYTLDNTKLYLTKEAAKKAAKEYWNTFGEDWEDLSFFTEMIVYEQ